MLRLWTVLSAGLVLLVGSPVLGHHVGLAPAPSQVPLGVLALEPGDAVFWKAPEGVEASVPACADGNLYPASSTLQEVLEQRIRACELACAAQGPCWTYALDLAGQGERLRVAFDVFPQRDRYCVDLYRPDGGFEVQFCNGVPGSGVVSLFTFANETFVEHPVPGRWWVRLDPVDVGASDVELRAQLERPREEGPVRLLAPNLRMTPPFEFTMRAPAVGTVSDLASPVPVSCMPSEVADYGAQRCLRFSVGPVNAGDGPLDLLLDAVTDLGLEVPVQQRLYRSDGSTQMRPAGTAHYHLAHAHYHHNGFGAPELLKVLDPATGELLLVGGGPKVGFCMGDYRMDDFHRIHQGRKDTIPSDCGLLPLGARMGMSTGWGDVYGWEVPGNYVEFAGQGDGLYVVRLTADPGGDILEADDGDNTGYAYVEVMGDDVTLLERGIGQSPWDPTKRVEET